MSERSPFEELITVLSRGYEGDKYIHFNLYEFNEERYDELLEVVKNTRDIRDITTGEEMTAQNLIKLLRALNQDSGRVCFSLTFLPVFYSNEEIIEIANVLSETPKLFNLYIGYTQASSRDAMVEFVETLINSSHKILEIRCSFVTLTEEEKRRFESIMFEDPNKWSRSLYFREYRHTIWGPTKGQEE